jgi:NhaP-type Na+/H+ or K+/H+ antiporter
VCYAVVVFSILVQGLTISRLVAWVVPTQDNAADEAEKYD